ncbi:MAG: Fe2+-dependent dioxygenase [Rhodobacter sp.]|nr:Fe2+-dependent dioxygenase [Rhodobacter sp.]
MFHVIDKLFDAAALLALQEAVAALDYEDGRRTAGAIAGRVKRNAQARQGAARDAVTARVQAGLMASGTFTSAARPKGFARLLVSRYEGGQAYGSHVDDALMPGGRTDLSFTLFLSDPASYRGGGLVVQERAEDRLIRLNAGEVVLYPSDTLHRVEPVTEGTRFAVVGWVTSWLRDPRQREMLFDLDQAIGVEQARGAEDGQLDRLAQLRSNLLRMWTE